MAARVTSKGQVTIPKAIRDALGIKPGSVVEFERSPDGIVALVAKGSRSRADKRVVKSRFAGLRGTATVKMTTREIMALTRGED